MSEKPNQILSINSNIIPKILPRLASQLPLDWITPPKAEYRCTKVIKSLVHLTKKTTSDEMVLKLKNIKLLGPDANISMLRFARRNKVFLLHRLTNNKS